MASKNYSPTACGIPAHPLKGMGMGGKPRPGAGAVRETRAWRKAMDKTKRDLADAKKKLDALDAIDWRARTSANLPWVWVSVAMRPTPRVFVWENQTTLTQDEHGDWGGWQGQNFVVASFSPEQWVALFGRPIVQTEPIKTRFSVSFIGGCY